MADTEVVSLKYDAKNNVFYFTSRDFNAMKIRGVARTYSEIGGYLYFFEATYPDGWFAIRDFKALFPSSRISKSAKKVLLYLKSVPGLIVDLHELNTRAHMYKKYPPYTHQARCIEAMLHYPRLAILAEQGLGKTYITVNYAEIKKKELGSFKMLVFAPKIVLRNWEEETKLHTDLNIIVYQGTEKQRKNIRASILDGADWDIIVTNYECVSNTIAKLKEYESIGKRSIAPYDEVQVDKKNNWFTVSEVTKSGKKNVFHLSNGEEVPSVRVTKARHKLDGGRPVNKDFEFFSELVKFDALIMDEGSRVKGHKSSRSMAVQSIADNIKNRYILSGTITLGNPLDVYMPYTILNPLIFGGNYWKFRKKHCEFSKFNNHVIIGYRNLDQLKNAMDPYTLSYTRDECLDLPDRILLDGYYDLSQEQILAYNHIVKRDSVIVCGRELDVSMPVVKINKLMQIVSGFLILPPTRNDEICNSCPELLGCIDDKIFPWGKKCVHFGTELVASIKRPEREYYTFPSNPKLNLFIEDIKDCSGQVILWTYYKKELLDVLEALDNNNISYILAGTKDCDLKFREDPTIKVFAGQISQGIGITLNTAKHTIYYSQSLSLEDRLQSMDRNYRIGQTSKVIVTDYQCLGTLESTVLSLLRAKKDVRDFIQSSIDCLGCAKQEECLEWGVRLYSEDCLLYGVRQEAESKTTIKLKPIYDPIDGSHKWSQEDKESYEDYEPFVIS